ncbi:hypothetical protein GV792_07750 [Nocardia cyriacigeorgica]|uniref:hypothetical protein n=1 Tax=Nocardia cyriacigeorgica TaxID=135487 RepID=UPI0013BE1E2D|nr:hypothetical protein [Nocardia cyriacigeorgica]NEW49946.1 hypothetical protein [Nocardia cyriacigeorgica]
MTLYSTTRTDVGGGRIVHLTFPHLETRSYEHVATEVLKTLNDDGHTEVNRTVYPIVRDGQGREISAVDLMRELGQDWVGWPALDE